MITHPSANGLLLAAVEGYFTTVASLPEAIPPLDFSLCALLGGLNSGTVRAPGREVQESCALRLLTLHMTCHPKNNLDHNRYDNITSLLTAVGSQRMWTSFIRNKDSAYVLAGTLLIYMERYKAQWPPDAEALPGVCELLNAWVRPDVPWVDIPAGADVLEHLFGAAWVHFYGADKRNMGDRVFRELPNFLPGLCAGQDAILSSPLPELSPFP